MRYCYVCGRYTEQQFYDDYRPGAPYQYYQCRECGACYHKCAVHGTFLGDRFGGEEGICTCFYGLEDEEAATEKRMRLWGKRTRARRSRRRYG